MWLTAPTRTWTKRSKCGGNKKKEIVQQKFCKCTFNLCNWNSPHVQQRRHMSSCCNRPWRQHSSIQNPLKPAMCSMSSVHFIKHWKNLLSNSFLFSCNTSTAPPPGRPSPHYPQLTLQFSNFRFLSTALLFLHTLPHTNSSRFRV